MEARSDGVWQAVLPESLRDQWQGEAVLRFRVLSNGSQPPVPPAAADGVLNIDASSELFRWTVDQLHAQGPVVHAALKGQPANVHEISSALFAGYEFPAGHIHLAGCSLEDRPILRVTQWLDGDTDAARLAHHFFLPNRELASAELIAQLHLADVEPFESKPPQENPDTTGRRIETACSHLGIAADQVVAATLIWCKFAIGKLAFEAGEAQATLPFSGWAAALANGQAKPPAFQCPHSGIFSHHLDITDDGRIAAADAVAVCDGSGERVLVSELETCAATGKRVVSQQLEHCGVSNERVLASSLLVCSQCNQRVSPNVIKGGRCSACRSLVAVRKDDPRMARLLDEYPKLDRWPRWRISETERMYVLLAASWLRQLLLVVEKESLAVAHVAISGRLLTNWSELPSAEQESLLG